MKTHLPCRICSSREWQEASKGNYIWTRCAGCGKHVGRRPLFNRQPERKVRKK